MLEGLFIHKIFFDYTLRNVTLGSALLGIVSGGLGTFAVLRRQSMLGDTISHAALPGIAVAFLLTGSKAPLVLLLGAALTGWLGSIFILEIVRNTRIKMDSAQGIILSVFFGAGFVLLNFIQKRPDAAQAGLDKFLFGQAATLMQEDVYFMAIVAVLTLLLVLVFWKEIKILSFDPDFSQVQGFPNRILEAFLTTLIVVSIVIGLQTVGVVLMSAMVVIPAAAARQWTKGLGQMMVLSSVIGAISGVSGALISSSIAKLPTGPTIVLSLAVIMLVSLVFAPQRGFLAKYLLRQRNRRRFAVEGILQDLYAMADQHQDHDHSHSLETLRAIRGREEGVDRGLRALQDMNYVDQDERGHWYLTKKGFEYASLQNKRLQEDEMERKGAKR